MDAIWLITRLFMITYETLLKDPKKQSEPERERERKKKTLPGT